MTVARNADLGSNARRMTIRPTDADVLTSARMAAGMTSRARRTLSDNPAG